MSLSLSFLSPRSRSVVITSSLVSPRDPSRPFPTRSRSVVYASHHLNLSSLSLSRPFPTRSRSVVYASHHLIHITSIPLSMNMSRVMRMRWGVGRPRDGGSVNRERTPPGTSISTERTFIVRHCYHTATFPPAAASHSTTFHCPGVLSVQSQGHLSASWPALRSGDNEVGDN